MAANKASSITGCRSLEVFFQPTAGRTTGVEVLLVDYVGPRRLTRRIGSVRLGLGRSALVGLTPSEVTWSLIDAFHTWLEEERGGLAHPTDFTPSRSAAPAPPEGVTGAAVDQVIADPLPGL